MSLTTPTFSVLTAMAAVPNMGFGVDAVETFASRAPGALAPALAGVGVLFSLVQGYFSMRVIRTRIDRPATTLDRDVVLSYLALVVSMALLGPNPYALASSQFWGASVCITGTRRRKALYAVLMLLASIVPLVIALRGEPLIVPVFVTLYSVVVYLIVWGVMLASNAAIIVLWDIVTEAHAARDAQARLAVSEERLRFSRDMHDLLGHSLSALAVKSELAARLAERDPQRAASEMTAVQHLARDALREVRAAVSGYREVDLAAEAASVQAVLTAAGVRCTVTGADLDLPSAQRAVASWVVREGTTNVLRHSSARSCSVVLRRGADTLVVEVHNDGVPNGANQGANRGQGGSAPEYGNGLSGLTERVAAAGGALTATHTGGGGFLLRAVLPLPASRAPSTGAVEDGTGGGEGDRPRGGTDGRVGRPGHRGPGTGGDDRGGREDVTA
ncbi:sensor histidine kinase [Streptomonospora nanhaiensis]|uniref:Two-component system sensor histidine kinase DesK n=1 Tax=Streptomonospora nanhaiensis TaxID=1323731 RepID=A0A853BSL0_9ACTN|nr:histidine kinase [Streptomonospora nanhaiensis]NYI97537.1 two-component system sensor histidine kinase DesK [Streptomonospora nanhaiensis]